MNAGWVYVLVNSAMPGLVKVGKTTRPVSERAAELSGVTGIATPFIVAFEQYFLDCDAAEEFAHAELERRGLRETGNREFFRAPPHEVIRVIMQAEGAADVPSPEVETRAPEGAESLLSDRTDSEFAFKPPPWEGLLRSADDCYFGFGDTIQNYPEALKLYTHAARLGALTAYERIGDIYRNGDGVREDARKALEFYHEGAKRGNYFCYAAMADVYAFERQLENAKKAWTHFFTAREQCARDELETSGEFSAACEKYVVFFCTNIGDDFLGKLRPLGNVTRREITERLSKDWRWFKEHNSPALEDRYRRAVTWAKSNLSDGIDDATPIQESHPKTVLDRVRDVLRRG